MFNILLIGHSWLFDRSKYFPKEPLCDSLLNATNPSKGHIHVFNLLDVDLNDFALKWMFKGCTREQLPSSTETTQKERVKLAHGIWLCSDSDQYSLLHSICS